MTERIERVSEFASLEQLRQFVWLAPEFDEFIDAIERELTELRNLTHNAENDAKRYHRYHLEWREKFYDAEKALAEADADRLVKQARIELLEKVAEAARANRHAVQNWRASPSGALEQVILVTEDAVDRALDSLKEGTRP